MEQNTFEKEVVRLNRQVTEHFLYFMQKRSEKFNISILQLQVLLYLDQNEFSVSELSRQLFMAKSNMSTLLKSMEKNGYLVRTRSKSDERRTNITLSSKGTQIVAEYKKDINQNTFQTLTSSIEQQECIIQGFTTLINLLEKARNQ